MCENEDPDWNLALRQIEAIACLETDLLALPEAIAADASGRLAARVTLGAFVEFLKSVELPSSTRGPIVELHFALSALDVGKTLPILERARVGRGEQKTSNLEWIQRAMAAATLELRYREMKIAGEPAPLETAALWVAYRIRHWPILKLAKPGKNQTNLDVGRIKRWREDINEDPNKAALQVYERYTVEPSEISAEALLSTQLEKWGIKTKKSQQDGF